jgi:hypothetical protein
VSGLVWFVDRCVGARQVPEALRAVGARVEVHDDHFARDAPDEVWLPEVGRRGWVVLTRDARIRWRPAERLAFERAGVGVFVVTAGQMTGPDLAALVARLLPRMTRLVERLARPFLVTISASGNMEVKLGERRGGVRK